MDTPQYTSEQQKLCDYCSAPAAHNGRGNFCSQKCYWASMRKPIERVCEICNQSFTVTATRIKPGQALFCSRKCRGIFRQRSRVECVCAQCGKEFWKFPSEIKRGGGRYCSNECSGIARTQSIECFCLNCGKAFISTPAKIENGSGKFCSRTCYAAAKSIVYRGSRNPEWRGGKSDYRGENWSQQRKAAYARDKGECQYCGKKPQKGKPKFQVHHIKPFRTFKGDYLSANQLTNLITLCHSCHGKAEHGKIVIQPYLF
jgi:HNH endonuclease